MALGKIWVLVDRADDKPAAPSLELLTKAAELGGPVEGVTWGDASGLAGEVGAYGATALHSVGDLGGGGPGPRVGGRLLPLRPALGGRSRRGVARACGGGRPGCPHRGRGRPRRRFHSADLHR